MRKRDTQRRETCAGGRKSENERDTPTGRWASSWSSWGSSNPERAASQASRGPGSDGPSVLRLMEVLSPGFGSPELPRTQLAYRLSLAPEGKGQENRSLVQSQVLAGQEETFSLTRKMGTAVTGRPSIPKEQGETQRRTCSRAEAFEQTSTYAAARPLSGWGKKKKKKKKKQALRNWGSTAQSSPKSELEARTSTLS